jgi:hypothetical protein
MPHCIIMNLWVKMRANLERAVFTPNPEPRTPNMSPFFRYYGKYISPFI